MAFSAVVAVGQMDAKPRIFRSYIADSDETPDHRETDVSSNFQVDTLPIWTVARATTAAPTYFRAVEVSEETYVDGGFGFNNPSVLAYHEVIRRHDNIGMILSIGSGTSKDGVGSGSINPRDRIMPFFAVIRHLQSLVNLVTETERSHQHMADIARAGRVSYFRFNVESSKLTKIKLDEWHKHESGGKPPRYTVLEQIEEVTNTYLERPDIQIAIQKCAHQLLRGRRAVL